ncbi:MAG: hypothetical protein LH478_02410 [Chitinophagaceae bacterium]|nr:hypothetical protein [Chitinophagaceae bacterium]
MKPTTHENNTYLGIVAVGNDKLTLKVLDTYGRIAKTIQTQFEEGMHELTINLTDLNVGTYVVNAFSGGRFLKAIKFAKND